VNDWNLGRYEGKSASHEAAWTLRSFSGAGKEENRLSDRLTVGLSDSNTIRASGTSFEGGNEKRKGSD
jgi:hypothetical protein